MSAPISRVFCDPDPTFQPWYKMWMLYDSNCLGNREGATSKWSVQVLDTYFTSNGQRQVRDV